jgi:hypothetical protein
VGGGVTGRSDAEEGTGHQLGRRGEVDVPGRAVWYEDAEEGEALLWGTAVDSKALVLASDSAGSP